MAEAFGMWPEDVMHATGGAKWAARWKVYRELLREASDNPPPSKRR